MCIFADVEVGIRGAVGIYQPRKQRLLDLFSCYGYVNSPLKKEVVNVPLGNFVIMISRSV